MDKGELFMQTPKQINISKTMSYALRHKPKQFYLESIKTYSVESCMPVKYIKIIKR